jgi:hypothetical protein
MIVPIKEQIQERSFQIKVERFVIFFSKTQGNTVQVAWNSKKGYLDNRVGASEKSFI